MEESVCALDHYVSGRSARGIFPQEERREREEERKEVEHTS
jgi:hypothetical protein